jgi:YVTN family beta-propeller protein
MNSRHTVLAVLLSVVVLAGLEIPSVRLVSPNPTPALAADRPVETASTQDAEAASLAMHLSRRLAQAGVYVGTIGEAVDARVADLTPRVYVPNSDAGTLDVIDPKTFRVVDHLFVGGIPHHVAPAWDLSRLYVDIERNNVLAVIDPRTGKPTGTIPVIDPYNLYFTPDGSKAIVVAERFSRLDFRNPQTWELIKSVPIPWPGIDHIDFSADGSYLMGSTEWSGMVAKVDTVAMQLLGGVKVGGLPIEVRLSPDGSVFYVANQGRHGVSIVDPLAMKEVGFLPTGRGAHGLQVSRDALSLYVSNRLEGSISVIDFAARQVTATWKIGGSPDMFQLSPDGRQLWASGRYHGEVYVVDTTTGALLHKIRTGAGTHGLCYFPNVGHISLGHNGVYR